jgi:hypothetical protein
LLKSQPPHYLRVHIHQKPYLVTAGDTIRLPFLMHGVLPGDILRLNRATLLGSRDYTLKAGAAAEDAAATVGWIDERLFVCRARVMGVEVEPLRIKEKTKRRQRHIKYVKSKHRYTVLRVMEIGVKEVGASLAAAAAEEDTVAGMSAQSEDVGVAKARGSAEKGSVATVLVEDKKDKIDELVAETAKVSI